MAKRVHEPNPATRLISSRRLIFTGLTITLLPFTGCTADAPSNPMSPMEPSAAVVSTGSVDDLTVRSATDSTVTLGWTQVDDGAGRPARYRVKYGESPLEDWKNAAIVCDRTIRGDEIGADISCTAEGLGADTSYDFQLMSYRVESGAWAGARYSNVATGTTSGSAGSVQDLEAVGAGQSAISVRWTQVDDGTGSPAKYRVRYAEPPFDWKGAAKGCDATGDTIGAELSCTFEAPEAATEYHVQLMSYRTEGGLWVDAIYSNVASAVTASAGKAGAVGDLAITDATETSFIVRWTQVDDGTGRAARYRVKHAHPAIDWSSAEAGCDRTGDAIGAEISCTVEGLAPGQAYEAQLMSYRLADGSSSWEGATYSNVAAGVTVHSAPEAAPAWPAGGVWISPAEVRALPTQGSAWNNLLSEAASDCGGVDLSDQEQSTNVCVMAKALVFARTGEERYRRDVVTALTQIVTAPRYGGRALALGRELGAYVIAADLIDLRSHDRILDEGFRTALRTLRTAYTTGAASSLIDCHERRPNNWGAHCGAARAAIAVYLDDAEDLARTAQVFKGYLGDRDAYSGFSHGGPASERDLSWQCDADRPVGINPAGCERSGMSLDGVLPDDQRRGGSFTTSPPQENYVWEAMQGLLAQAVILHRAGYPVWEWEDRALLRAVEWLHAVVDFPAAGDDSWQPHIVNHYYGTRFPAPVPSRAGKNVGWTDWTHPE